MAKMIPISFKDSEEDLYKYLKGKSSPSIYIKEMLRLDMNGEGVISRNMACLTTANDTTEQKQKKYDQQAPLSLSSLKNVGRWCNKYFKHQKRTVLNKRSDNISISDSPFLMFYIVFGNIS